MSALLVEILLPVAAVIKFEASLPVVKKFVSMLFNHCYEHTKKGRHSTVSLIYCFFGNHNTTAMLVGKCVA